MCRWWPTMADETIECWLCNVNQLVKDIVVIDVSMPDKANVCIDCVACVLRRCNIGEREVETLITSVTGVDKPSPEPGYMYRPPQDGAP